MPDDEQRAFDKSDARAMDRLLPRDLTFRNGEKYVVETTVKLAEYPTATHVTIYRTDKRGRIRRKSAITFEIDPDGEVTLSWDASGIARIAVPDNDAHE